MSTIHHDVTTPYPPQVQEVVDGVFAYIQPDGTWWINNTGFLVGRRGVITIDTCATVRRTRAYLDAIRTVTAQPVRQSAADRMEHRQLDRVEVRQACWNRCPSMMQSRCR